ncbi:hypothetical protein OYE22_06680 [Streptomyces sp. 71268]|uniref:hypothetical protein n=1 Tax=Streptomyces sp. 71268 TaxID=3002640 RepID=UPI0023F8C93C|nr:hypothetical protein [Streptomyces sp. 71268]WEV24917.1 hypothetical protein OYE22_06680 [Streptomyces sp. 71268]
MYELSRVLLRGVGPQSARYEDVLLDFSGVGAPVANSRQGDIFDIAERPRRPSPASVLFLENGGGKSVLIKLIFSVVLPGRRNTVGTRNPRTLEGFVRRGDVAHVVLEWTHVASGKRLVTGKVSQWKERRTSDESDLVERWYHFRPGLTLDLETLPVEEDGNYIGLTEYCERLRLADIEEPALGYRNFQLHGEWTDRLMALGLDPELFRYQRAMNDDEGEAADAFSLGSDQAFVNFLLSAVLPLQPARDLAEVLGTYADKLADRGVMELEKTFVEEALAVLVPLSEAREKSIAAAAKQRGTRVALDRFIHQVRARATQEKQAFADRAQGVVQLKDEVRRAQDRHQHATAVAAELSRSVAELRLAEAERDHHAAEREWEKAVAVETGWQAVPAVLRDLEAVAVAQRLRARVTETEAAARPALDARDEAARVLWHALRGMVRNLTDEADGLGERATECDGEARSAQSEYEAAVAAAAEGEAKAGALDGRVTEVQEAVAGAVREGLVPDGLEVADAAAQAESEAAAHRERVGEGARAVERLEREYQEAEKQDEVTRGELASAHHAHDIARREYKAADDTMRRLAEDLQHAGIYSGEVGELDIEAAGLADRLAHAQGDAETARIDVRIAMVADERALTSLETNDLLPSSLEAVRVCEMLHERQIPACTGWEYLASIPDVQRRAELVDQFPQLATGVLCNDAEQLELAAEILGDAGVTVTGFIALGTTTSLHGEGGLPPGASFVVPPHPALYDERVGESERLVLTARRDDHRRRLAELDETLRTHGRFAARLAQWRDACPPGRLAALHDAMVSAEEVAHTARGAAAVARGLKETKAEALRTARDELSGLRDGQPRLDRRVEALRVLVRSTARVPGWQAEALRMRGSAREHRQVAVAARARMEAAQQAAADARRAADVLRGTVVRAEEELAGLPIRESEYDADEPHTTLDQPLEVLRRLYRSAADEYERLAVGASLKADLDQAEREERAAGKALASIGESERAMARELLTGAEGVDSAALDAGRSRAKRQVASARARLDAVYEVVVRCRTALDAIGEAPPGAGTVDLAPFESPRDAAHGERMTAAAEQARDEAAALADELRHLLDKLVEEQAEARQTARAFTTLVDLLGKPSEEDVKQRTEVIEAVPVYEGDAAGARERHDALLADHTDAQRAAADAESAERTLADRLAARAADSRFEELQSPSRRIMLSTPREDLPDRAGTWAADLRPRLRTLEIDLDSIDRHRQQIVLQFVQQVRDALRTLKRAQRLSQLPEGLGSWSGQQFLQITFPEVTDEVLAELLGRVVDTAAVEGLARRGSRDARQLVLKGVEAAVAPKGFRVTVLKPDIGLAVERVRVAESKDIFSGGQILTAAIVLYCTMAALRANDRGQARRQYSGVLFLDNPIGRASALYLLRLQQAVAKALGVQLVYTTGLYDKVALDVFPLVIRMRNDADLRARRRYLSVADRSVGQHIDSLRDGAGGDITVVRHFQRPTDEAVAG